MNIVDAQRFGVFNYQTLFPDGKSLGRNRVILVVRRV
jgi:hypothetical protein